MISDMLIKWPSKHIMIGKTDLGATYRRFHANAQIAATYIAIVVKLAFLCICLPFGTTLTSAVYTTISEAEIDFENNLLTDTPWDATNLQWLHQQLIPREDYLPASDPLVKAYHIAVDIKAKEVSMDSFIYEIITITIDDPRWVESANNAALFIVHTIFRPWHSNKPLKLYYLPHSANLWEKVSLPSARHVWSGTSIPVIYGYSYCEKMRKPGYTTSGNPQR